MTTSAETAVHPDGTPCRTPGAHCAACCYPHEHPPFRHNGSCPALLLDEEQHVCAPPDMLPSGSTWSCPECGSEFTRQWVRPREVPSRAYLLWLRVRDGVTAGGAAK